MNIIDRARFVLFGDVPSATKKASGAVDDPLARTILFGLGRAAVWSRQDYLTLEKEGYEKCMAVYSCVTLIARTAAGIEFKAIAKDGSDLDTHPVLDLLARPNQYDGKRQFLAKRFSYLLLSGNSYIQAARTGPSFPPGALFLPMPHRMYIVPGTGAQLVGSYEYRSQTGAIPVPIAVEDILHSRLFHPTDDFYGLSPLAVAARGVDVANMAAEWNMRLLQNDMRPPGVLATEGGLSPEQRARLDAVLAEYQGYENAGKPLVLEGGLKWQQISMNPKDLDWLKASIFNKREIAAVYNIAPELIGDSQSKTYSNYQEARRALYTDTVLPLMYEFIDELNRWLCPMYKDGVTLDMDKDAIELLQEDRKNKFLYISQADFMSVNEKREALGIDPLDGPEGDLILVPNTLVPLDQASTPKPAPVIVAPGQTPPPAAPQNPPPKQPVQAPAAVPPKKSFRVKVSWAAPEQKRALWDNFVARVETKEKGLTGIARAFLKEQAQRVGKTPHHVNLVSEARAFHAAVIPWALAAAQRAGNAGARTAKGELPDIEEKVDLFNLTDEQKRHLDDMILRSGTKISETTMAYVVEELALAEKENWTTEQLTQALIRKLGDFAGWRCRQIARTETAKVENGFQVEGYKQNEYITKKIWICSFVPESREAHMEADSQEVSLDEDFIVGGEAMSYPGDPRGSAGEVVNCLCTTAPGVD